MRVRQKNIKPSFSKSVILLFLIIIPFVNFNHHNYNKAEGVIIWDIKSYYAYLPATFIYQDLSLEFMDDYPDKELNKWIWPIESPTGKRSILTSSGMSVMYSPFFFPGHAYAKMSSKYEADGYSKPYHVALTFSAYIYFLLSLLILRKILLKFFSERSTSLTLFFVGAGTNLFYYISYEAPMPHAYNFFLIILMLYLIIRWNEKVNIKNTIFLGLTAGLITLIRPTNVIVLFLIPLYGVKNIQTLKDNFFRLLKHWHFILLMAFCFILVWVPQFAYWFYVSGKIFYYSYGEKGSRFFFNNPQITDFLFSYKKGWLIYTPLMLFSIFGIIRLFKIKHVLSWAILFYLIINVYILSSWWSWWYGGAFGIRSMVDSYGLLAIPLAAVIDNKYRNKIFRYTIIGTLFILTFYNQFQIQQYRRGAIHYWWMNKESYFENFLKLNPTCKYWKIIQKPDYDKARKGIYEFTHTYNKHCVISDSTLRKAIIQDISTDKIITDSLLNIGQKDSVNIDSLYLEHAGNLMNDHKAGKYFKQLKIDHLYSYINNCDSWRREIERKSKKSQISFSKALNDEAERVYKNYSEQYEDTFSK